MTITEAHADFLSVSFWEGSQRSRDQRRIKAVERVPQILSYLKPDLLIFLDKKSKVAEVVPKAVRFGVGGLLSTMKHPKHPT